MGCITIQDGTGSGKSAKVNSGQRLYTRGVDSSEGQQANFDGNAYNINTGLITLTNDTETPVMYVKNNEDHTLFIEAIAVGIQPSTGGGTDACYIKVIRNPKTGTIISGATDVDINSNRNYASSNTLLVDAYKGATGNTMTDGDDHLLILQNDGGRAFATINEVIPKGTSIGIKITPPSGNTSMEVYAALICYLRDPNE